MVMKKDRVVLRMHDVGGIRGVVHNTPSISLSKHTIIVKLGLLYVNTWTCQVW